MNRELKLIGLGIIVILSYYGLQYASSAVHYNCAILKDDCPPPIYGAAEIIYQTTVRPPWLTEFEIEPTTYYFKDGQFSFWEGEVDGKPVVIRVREDQSPVLRWIFDEQLPRGTGIYPATGEHVMQWLADHPEYKLN